MRWLGNRPMQHRCLCERAVTHWYIWLSLPIGAVFALQLPQGTVIFAVSVMVLETAHVVSPMVTAWAKPGLRTIVRREWIKHVAVPIAIMGSVAFLPVTWVALVYWPWNSFHFGMQNFGVMALYGLRKLGFVVLCVTMLSISVAPLFHPSGPVAAILMGAFSFNHWITDIGLSSRVAHWHWRFILVVLAIGAIWLCLRQGPLSVRVFPQIIAIRYGIGIVHFIYSARIWKVSDPQVRAAIGRDR
jgi:hypothetical protein